MKSKLQRLQAYLNGNPDPEIEAELEDPNSPLLQGIQEACGPRPDYPPPGDWHAYLFPNGAPRDAVVDTPAEAPVTTAPRSRARIVTYVGGAVLAASLLIALGLLLGQGGGEREVAFAARATAREGEVRGPGRIVQLTIENRTPRRAFVTVVGMSGARSPVHSERGGEFIDVAPDQSRAIELPATFDQLTDAVVVLTATPAGDAITKALEARALPADPDAARAAIADELSRFGFTGAATEVVRLRPAGP